MVLKEEYARREEECRRYRDQIEDKEENQTNMPSTSAAMHSENIPQSDEENHSSNDSVDIETKARELKNWRAMLIRLTGCITKSQ